MPEQLFWWKLGISEEIPKEIFEAITKDSKNLKFLKEFPTESYKDSVKER